MCACVCSIFTFFTLNVMCNSILLQIVEQCNWLPDPLSPAHGMELEKLSFLGPFFALSVFAEDNVSLSKETQLR